MKKIFSATLIFVLCFSIVSHAHAISFNSATTLSTNPHVTGFRVYSIGDVDNNGTLDLVGEGTANYLSILKNIGTTPVYQSQSHLAAESTDFYGSALGDLDGDGDLDLVTAGPNGGATSPNNVYNWNSTLGRFDKVGSMYTLSGNTLAAYGTAALIGDFTNDGKKDVLWLTPQTAYLAVNSTTVADSITFSSVTNLNLAMPGNNTFGNFSAVTGDFNNDGNLDFVVVDNSVDGSSHYGGYAIIEYGNGNGTFSGSTLVAHAGDGYIPMALATGDFNKDGKLDIALLRTNFTTSHYGITIFSRKSDNSGFNQGGYTGANGLYRSIAVADMNNDTYPDIVALQSSSGPMAIHLNPADGTSTFSSNPSSTFTVAPQDQFLVADVTGDGLKDVITLASNNIQLYSQVTPFRPFITTWKTDNPGTSASDQITIPTVSGLTYNYSVDWGDSTTSTGLTGTTTHIYSGGPGTYTVSISGTFPGIQFNNGGDKAKILSVEQWGDVHWLSMQSAFYGASHLVVNATDAPDLSAVTDASNMFRGSGVTNQNFSSWDMSHVINMDGMFRDSLYNGTISSWNVSNVTNTGNLFFGNTAFNQNIGSWSTSQVTNMGSMFYGATAFNQPLNSWNTSSVTSLGAMFDGASSFNQPLSNWDVSHVTYFGNVFEASPFNQDISNWNTSSVTDMYAMFAHNSHFNQNIAAWNTSHVTNMDSMFYAATSFDQDLHAWDISHVTNMTDMFNQVTLSQTHYDSMLNIWSGLNVQSNVPFDAGNSTYCAVYTRGRLAGFFGWTILDGGMAGGCPTTSPTIVSNGGGIPVQFVGHLTSSVGSPMPVSNTQSAAVPVTATPAIETHFSRTLKIGMSGTDVKMLQQMLNGAGFTVAPSGAGSKGNETNYFGAATKNALANYQRSHAISPASGLFGPITMKFVNAL